MKTNDWIMLVGLGAVAYFLYTKKDEPIINAPVSVLPNVTLPALPTIPAVINDLYQGAIHILPINIPSPPTHVIPPPVTVLYKIKVGGDKFRFYLSDGTTYTGYSYP